MKESELQPPQKEKPLLRFLQRYGVPILLTTVAIHQFYRVHAEGLSSWRGGGFGMYGGFHPRHHDLWWIDLETGEKTRFTKEKGVATEDHRYPGVRPFLTYVNGPALKRYHESLPPEIQKKTVLQVWQLNFEPETGTVSRKLLISAGPEDTEAIRDLTNQSEKS